MGAVPTLINAAVGGYDRGVARNQQLQDEQRQQNLQRNWGILNDPSSTPEMKQAAGTDIQNQYPTPAHKGTFLSDILHIHSKQPSAQPIPPPPPSNPISGAPSAPSAPPQSANDELDVPYTFGQPFQGATTSAPPKPTPGPSGPPLAAAASAPTPQAAMDLWKQYHGPAEVNAGIVQQHATAAANAAQALAEKNNAARIMEAQIRAHGNVSMQKMDAAAQSLGAEDFASASPDVKMQAMKAMATANRAPAWKSVVDGNTVYAVSSLDPNQRTPIGHKDDLTQRQEFRTMTNPDGSTFLVPVTVWTKKGSSAPLMETQDDQGGATPVSANTPHGPNGASPAPAIAATPSATSPAPSATPQEGIPVSSATPQGVPGAPTAASVGAQNPGARQPGTKPAGGAVKAASRIPPSTVGAPIPFGGKPNDLQKADASLYRDNAKENEGKQQALTLAQESMKSPSPTSDQQLVFSWLRTNLSGFARLNNTELTQAKNAGSWPQKADNWWSLATTGKLTPEIRNMMFKDIQRGASVSQSFTDSSRDRVQQDMGSSNRPVSSKTPKSPNSQEPVAYDKNGKAVRYSGKGSRKDPNNYVPAQ